MIERAMKQKLLDLAQKMPVIGLVGPRQSGKTTLAQEAFPGYMYVSLEDLKMREFALQDPHAFFKRYENAPGLILDEIQEAPELLSYIQVYSDAYKRPGYFILTGSQNFLVHDAITQTLAGRIALFTLLPLSIAELQHAGLLPGMIEECVFRGQYPRVYDASLEPTEWFPSYVRTYVERDVRNIRQIVDFSLFQRFLGLCAGRIGQLLNVTSLANDCGITVATANAWLSLLEASFIIFLLQPYYKNFGKRLIKSPKLYFYDTGLACSLLGIESVEQVMRHYLRGGLIESLVLCEFLKQRYNQGLSSNLYFWRDKTGHEIDGLIVRGDVMVPIEVKAGMTVSQGYFDGLRYWYELTESAPNGLVVYAGAESQKRSLGTVVSWRSIEVA